MRLKMARGGTTRGSDNLCLSCKFSTRRRGARSNYEVIRCDMLRAPDNIIEEPIAECSEYQDASHPSLSAMREIAWIVNADKKTGKAGFLSPKDYDKAVKEEKVEKIGTLVLPDGSLEWED